MTTYIFLLIPIIAHCALDYKNYNVLHWFSAALVTGISIALGFIDSHITGHYFWQFAIYALSVHFAFFDLVFNLINGHTWNYHGTITNPNRALTDRVWDYLPWYGEILVRLWVLSVGYGVYYHLDLITG